MTDTDRVTTILNGPIQKEDKSNLDYFNDYTSYMRATGRSESAISTQLKHIRTLTGLSEYGWNTDFLNATEEQLQSLYGNLNHYSDHYRKECIVSFRHFLDYMREQQGLEPRYKRPNGEWAKKSPGRYRFENEFREYRAYLESIGLTKYGAANKALRAKKAVKVMDGLYSFARIDEITYEMFDGLKKMLKDLDSKTQGDILFCVDDFILHFTGRSVYKAKKNQSFKGRYEPKGDLGKEFVEWRNKYCDDLYEANWRRSVEAKRKELTLTYGRFTECFGPISIFEINHHHFRKIVPFMAPLKQVTIRGYLVNFGSFIKFVTGKNPMDEAKMGWSQDDVRRIFITFEEWQKIVPNIRKEHRLIFLFGASLGLRRTEISNVKVSDIDTSSEPWILHVSGKGKGSFGKKHDFELDDFLRQEVEDYLEYRQKLIEEYGDRSEGRLFVRDNRFRGTPMSTYSIGQIVTDTGIRAGVKLSPHALRRYYCMTMVMDNVPDDTIRRSMRHKHFETTADHYIGDLRERKDMVGTARKNHVYAGF